METLEVSCRYKLESKIGEGTFGTVYSGEILLHGSGLADGSQPLISILEVVQPSN